MLRLFAKSQSDAEQRGVNFPPLQQKEGFPNRWEILFCGRKLAQWVSEGTEIRPDELWS